MNCCQFHEDTKGQDSNVKEAVDNIVLQGPIVVRGHKLYFFMKIKGSIIVLGVIEIICFPLTFSTPFHKFDCSI